VIEVGSPVRCAVGRHARATKTLRWHIDYLLTARATSPPL